MSQWGVQWSLLFSFLSQDPLGASLTVEAPYWTQPQVEGENVLPKCKLPFGIALASSKITCDILPLPGESPRISFAVDARDVLIFIFNRPRCVERRSRLTASLAWAFKVNYSLVQEGIDGVRQPFGQREGSNSWALLRALNWNGQISLSEKV